MKEIWKDIIGYERLYQISNLGRVKSLHRNGTINTDKILKTQFFKTGYCYINLNNKINKKKSIHRLVAQEFIINPENKRTVNHINGIKSDNRAENLEWATYSENLKHAHRIGLKKPSPNMLGRKGKNCPNSRPILQYNLKMEFIKEWDCITNAGENLNIDISSIAKVCKRKRGRKTAGKFIWKFKN